MTYTTGTRAVSHEFTASEKRRGTKNIYCASDSNRLKTIPVETQKESDLRDGNGSDIMPISENDMTLNRKGQSRGKMAVLISRTTF
jgi:hypothetical protein